MKPTAAPIQVALATGWRVIMTLLQATAVTERWGSAHYGHLSGILSAPIMVTTALGPFVGAALASLLNGYAAMFVALGVVVAVAAMVAAATSVKPHRSWGACEMRVTNNAHSHVDL